MNAPVIGLLPLYIALYDESSPQMRPIVEKFAKKICTLLEMEGLKVIPSPICTVKSEFADAVAMFEKNADAIITLHLAYSPSLESSDVLKNTSLPILILDTAPDSLFDFTINSDAINYNHGIHGVQDMCNLLRRNKKAYRIYAGHYEKSDVIHRISNAAKAVAAAHAIRGMKTGIIGEPFSGMGDFAVSDAQMASLGITAKKCCMEELAEKLDRVTDDEIRAEYEKDKKICDMRGICFDEYQKTERVGFAVRKWLEENQCGAFTMNFQSAGTTSAFPTMPFSEAGKAMSRGIGYAGEGDLLTASLVGALLCAFKEVTFVEMFCPDWENNTVFLSHMGETNYDIIENKHMIIKPFPYAPGFDPTCIMGHMKGGKACYVNIAPGADDTYTLILADGEVISLPDNIDSFNDSIAGWFKPNVPIDKFLENYSLAGGTHHSALVYGASAEELRVFADTLNIQCTIIRQRELI